MNNRELAIGVFKHPLIQEILKRKLTESSVVNRLIVQEVLEEANDDSATGEVSLILDLFEDQLKNANYKDFNMGKRGEGALGLALIPLKVIGTVIGGVLDAYKFTTGADVLEQGHDLIRNKMNEGFATLIAEIKSKLTSDNAVQVGQILLQDKPEETNANTFIKSLTLDQTQQRLRQASEALGVELATSEQFTQQLDRAKEGVSVAPDDDEVSIDSPWIDEFIESIPEEAAKQAIRNFIINLGRAEATLITELDNRKSTVLSNLAKMSPQNKSKIGQAFSKLPEGDQQLVINVLADEGKMQLFVDTYFGPAVAPDKETPAPEVAPEKNTDDETSVPSPEGSAGTLKDALDPSELKNYEEIRDEFRNKFLRVPWLRQQQSILIKLLDSLNTLNKELAAYTRRSDEPGKEKEESAPDGVSESILQEVDEPRSNVDPSLIRKIRSDLRYIENKIQRINTSLDVFFGSDSGDREGASTREGGEVDKKKLVQDINDLQNSIAKTYEDLQKAKTVELTEAEEGESRDQIIDKVEGVYDRVNQRLQTLDTLIEKSNDGNKFKGVVSEIKEDFATIEQYYPKTAKFLPTAEKGSRESLKEFSQVIKDFRSDHLINVYALASKGYMTSKMTEDTLKALKALSDKIETLLGVKSKIVDEEVDENEESFADPEAAEVDIAKTTQRAQKFLKDHKKLYERLLSWRKGGMSGTIPEIDLDDESSIKEGVGEDLESMLGGLDKSYSALYALSQMGDGVQTSDQFSRFKDNAIQFIKLYSSMSRALGEFMDVRSDGRLDDEEEELESDEDWYEPVEIEYDNEDDLVDEIIPIVKKRIDDEQIDVDNIENDTSAMLNDPEVKKIVEPKNLETSEEEKIADDVWQTYMDSFPGEEVKPQKYTEEQQEVQKIEKIKKIIEADDTSTDPQTLKEVADYLDNIARTGSEYRLHLYDEDAWHLVEVVKHTDSKPTAGVISVVISRSNPSGRSRRQMVYRKLSQVLQSFGLEWADGEFSSFKKILNEPPNEQWDLNQIFTENSLEEQLIKKLKPIIERMLKEK
jgi:hypothetical protein